MLSKSYSGRAYNSDRKAILHRCSSMFFPNAELSATGSDANSEVARGFPDREVRQRGRRGKVRSFSSAPQWSTPARNCFRFGLRITRA